MPQCPSASAPISILFSCAPQVCSGQAWATAEVLYNVQAVEAEKRRLKELNQTEFDLRQTRGGDFPALPPTGETAAKSAAVSAGASWGSGMKVTPAPRKHASASLGGGGRGAGGAGGGGAAASTVPAGGRSAGGGGRPERAASAGGGRGNAAGGGGGVADAASMKLAARWVQARRDRDYA